MLHNPDGLREWKSGTDRPIDFSGPADFPFTPFDLSWTERPIAARFEQIARQNGARIAINDGSIIVDYRRLRCAAYDLARRIRATVPRGRAVAVTLPNGLPFTVAALACMIAGRPYLPIDLDYPQAHAEGVLREALPAAVIAVAGGDERRLPAGLPVLDIDTALRATDESPVEPPGEGEAALILYTSGSTGRPKGICNGEPAILHRVAQFTNACHIGPRDRLILLSSPGTIAGARDTLTALLNGAALYIAEPRVIGLAGVLRALRENEITICYAVPALLRALLRAPGAKEAFASTRIMRLGGDQTFASDIALCRQVLPASCHVLVGFGSTEAPTLFQWFVPPDWSGDSARLPCGYATPGFEYALADESAGEGELVVRSRYLALGLWQEGRLEPGPFSADPRDPGMRIFATGDLVRLRGDGLAELAGRKDRQIKIHGRRGDPGEVEALLRLCDGAADAAVIVRRSGDTARLVAFAVPDAARALDGETLKRALAQRLPPHLCPAQVHVVAAIPYLPGFKADGTALARLDDEARRAAPSTDNLAAPADSSLIETVRACWIGQFGKDTFHLDRAWDEDGADLLKALEFWLLLEECLGRSLPFDSLEPGMRIGAIVEDIERKLRLPPDNPGDDAPLVFVMGGILGDEPSFARFRSALGNRLHVTMIDTPPRSALTDGRRAFDTIVANAVARISAACAGAPCLLAGYSFGGFVAFETARRLVAAGHEVAFVGLIDTHRRSDRLAETAGPLQRLFDQPPVVKLGRWALRKVVMVMLRASAIPSFAPLVRRAARLSPRITRFYERRLYLALVGNTLSGWAPKPLDLPVVLFRSDDQPGGLPYDYGWGALCHKVEVVAIGGTHFSIMRPPLLQILCAQFADRVERAQAHGAPPRAVEA